MEPIPTGIPGLDQVLQGGLRPRALHIIGGLPGTGKTTLAQQIAFNHAKTGGRVLYLAALSETAERLVGHASGFQFFDPAEVAERIYYVSLYPKLEEAGLPGALDEIRRLAAEQAATLVCIDGMSTLKATASSALDFRRFVFDLNAQLRALGATSLMLGPWAEWEATDPEFVAGDGIVSLSLEGGIDGGRRYLEVLKLRGAEHLTGKQSMTITQGGMMVYPRLEAAMHRDGIEEPPAQWTRVGTGASRLDQVLGGGIPSVSATLVAGVPGAGKTTLALSFLAEGGRAGEKGIYLGFDEAPSRLIARADTLGFGLGDMVKDGTLEVRWMPPLMPIPDQVAWQLLDAVDDAGARRVVIDGLDPVMAVLESVRRAEPFLAALMTALRSRSVTTIATSRLSRDPSAERCPAYEQMSAFDNVIHLQQVEARSEVHRLISVAKLRDSDFDTAIREFTISGGGLHVTDPFGGAEGGVTGIGHWRGRRAR